MINFLKVGQIINTHGIRGEVKVYPLTDDVKRFSSLKKVFIKKDEEYIPIEVQGVKYIKNLVILKLSGIEDMNEAMRYKNVFLYVDRENAVELSEDTYFIADLIGIEVIEEDGRKLGNIVSVFSTGSNDVYEIKQENGKTFLIPAIKEVVKNVDIENKKMIVKLLEGLL
ncbi:16S rRNA-processing protein RimM [Fervidicella metallireducens AeB]|uniref:Ribosome maturation factor RimM n=1 Tax=Fervidicella metallireducens AeB TaxID=1403537 RepID=A0A017RZF3_9CLOT|nr:ribosome maturation factor RimM [Fervidicella metallireducens]EYE89320.1 16S rRNA-processing protein RimM [Fervidicella metallireducens AeB]